MVVREHCAVWVHWEYGINWSVGIIKEYGNIRKEWVHRGVSVLHKGALEHWGYGDIETMGT